PMSHTTLRQYDGYGRLVSEKFEDYLTTHYQYDDTRPVLKYRWSEGRISRPPDLHQGTADEILHYSHSDTGVVLEVDEYQIDQAERVIVSTKKLFDPEDNDKILPLLRAGGETTKTWYTAAGRLQKVTDFAGRPTEFKYNPQGRQQKTVLPGGHSI